jgi:hypothetical protein
MHEDPPRTQRVIAGVLGGLGIVGLGVGGAFALSAKSKYDASLQNCAQANKDACTAEGVSQRNDARSAGNIATIALAAGGAALLGGVVLWFTAPKESGRASAPNARIGLAPTLGGAMLRGQW